MRPFTAHLLPQLSRWSADRARLATAATCPADPSQSDTLDRSIGQINNLIQSDATATGRVMNLATVGLHHMWLGLTAIPKSDRDDLLEASILTEGPFRSIS